MYASILHTDVDMGIPFVSSYDNYTIICTANVLYFIYEYSSARVVDEESNGISERC